MLKKQWILPGLFLPLTAQAAEPMTYAEIARLSLYADVMLTLSWIMIVIGLIFLMFKICRRGTSKTRKSSGSAGHSSSTKASRQDDDGGWFSGIGGSSDGGSDGGGDGGGD